MHLYKTFLLIQLLTLISFTNDVIVSALNRECLRIRFVPLLYAAITICTKQTTSSDSERDETSRAGERE